MNYQQNWAILNSYLKQIYETIPSKRHLCLNVKKVNVQFML